MDINTTKSYTKYYVIAWIFGLIFYFLDYVIRSAPAVMFPELSQSFSVNEIRLVEIIGTYYYTYSTCSLIAGIALDRFGAQYSLFAGAFILGIGCLLVVLLVGYFKVLDVLLLFQAAYILPVKDSLQNHLPLQLVLHNVSGCLEDRQDNLL